MPKQIQNELNAIVKTISATGLVSKLILFGSLARGEQTESSDIDLCALTTPSNRRPIDIAIELRKKLHGVQTRPLDLLAFNEVKFAEDAGRPTSFAYVINNEGIVLYDKH